MAVICYSKQRPFQRGIEYRNPTWFAAPLFHRGDRVVVVGHHPKIAAAYSAAGAPVTVQDEPYFGDGEEAPEAQQPVDTQPEAVLLPKVTHRRIDPEPAQLISMTKAELQAEASRLGIPYKAAASRSELLALLGAR